MKGTTPPLLEPAKQLALPNLTTAQIGMLNKLRDESSTKGICCFILQSTSKHLPELDKLIVQAKEVQEKVDIRQ